MRAGIIAAGTGQRLKAGGFKMAKPLVRVAGKSLIEHTLTQMADAGVESVTMIVNDAAGTVAEFVRDHPWPMKVDVVVRTTANSLESLRVIAPSLTGEIFLVGTVDTIAMPGAMKLLVAAPMADRDATLAVAPAGRDEHPVYVKFGDGTRIKALGQKAKGSPTVTAGWYLFSDRVRSAIENAPPKLDKLRLFLTHLVDSGFRVHGESIGSAVDVDDFDDVRDAQEMLKK